MWHVCCRANAPSLGSARSWASLCTVYSKKLLYTAGHPRPAPVLDTSTPRSKRRDWHVSGRVCWRAHGRVQMAVHCPGPRRVPCAACASRGLLSSHFVPVSGARVVYTTDSIVQLPKPRRGARDGEAWRGSTAEDEPAWLLWAGLLLAIKSRNAPVRAHAQRSCAPGLLTCTACTAQPASRAGSASTGSTKL